MEKEENATRLVKVVKKYKERTVTIKVNRHVQARRKLAKFGDCQGCPPGLENNVTYIDSKAVELDFEKKKEEEKPLTQTVCRRCKQPGHWTLQCPFFAETEDATPELKTPLVQRDNQPAAQKPGVYRPPQRTMGGDAGPQAAGRGGRDARGGDMKKHDGFGIRISNISYETTDDDLRVLCGKFGRITRVSIPMDSKFPGKHRNFAFVRFYYEDDARAALERLNGHGYGNLILSVEWAKDQNERPRETEEERNTRVIDAQRRRF